MSEIHDPRAEQLQELLDRLAAGETEAILAHVAPDMASEARLAASLAQLLPISPDPAFRADLQMRLQAGADRPSRSWVAWLAPRLAAAVIALALVFASAVGASASSLPGGALYGLKRATEGVRVALEAHGAARAELLLSLAGERLREIESLAQKTGRIDAEVLAGLVAARQRAAAEPGADQDEVRRWSEQAASALMVAAGSLDSASRQRVLGVVAQLAASPRAVSSPLTPAGRGADATRVIAEPSDTPTPTPTTTPATPSARGATPTTGARTATPAAIPSNTAPSDGPVGGEPPTPIPAGPTSVAGGTDPAVNPRATERAIRLTEDPRETQAVPETPDTGPTEPPAEPPQP